MTTDNERDTFKDTYHIPMEKKKLEDTFLYFLTIAFWFSSASSYGTCNKRTLKNDTWNKLLFCVKNRTLFGPQGGGV